uniref:non-specific serine/threonine protein kinase n=1 Tax=Scylla olivacea TaxID=85551 RepID=A0A0P4W3R0_SCYOL
MASGGREDVQDLLEKLHHYSSGNELRNARSARDIVVDISEHLTKDLSPVQYDLFLSHVFGEKGIIAFGTRVTKEQAFVDVRNSTLDLIITLLMKDTKKIIKYVGDITNYTLFLYNADKSTKVCAHALEAFCLLLEKFSSHVSVQDINLHQLIEGICIQTQRYKGSTILHHQLRTLGVLAKVYPENVRCHSAMILKIYKDHIARHMGQKTDLIALAGVLRGLTLYLFNFPEGIDDDPLLYKTLFEHVRKALNPNLDLHRRDAQRAALELISSHGDKFSAQLYDHYDTLFPWFIQWCSSKNRDDYKAAIPALDTFITVLSNILELQSSEDKKTVEIFKYLLQEYNKMLETGKSTNQVSLAVKGYGLLSGACRILLSPMEVHTMFLQVLSASHHAFYQSSEMLENKLSNLPSYIEALADIICNMSTINVGIVENMLQLALALVENFPSVSVYKTFLAYRALFKLFYAIHGKAEYFQDFIHSFVYKSVIHTCSHAPEIDSLKKESELWKESNDSEESGGKWEGFKKEAVTYKNYLPLWKAIMMPEKVSYVKIPGVSTTILTEISSKLYSEYITSTIEIAEKLDLSTFKQEEIETNDITSDDGDVATSDPISGLSAKTPKDFQVYMNVIALLEEVLPLQYEDQLQGHVSRLCWFFIRCSSEQPLVSAHYTSLTTILVCAQKMRYFEKTKDPEVETLIHLITSYVKDVLQRCRQLRDQLLASCLTLILKLPVCIVIEIFPRLIVPLQMALHLGVSYLPLAEVCIAALCKWTHILPSDILHQHLPAVLPLLLPYLRSKETGEVEVQTRVITVKMAYANQRRKVDQKKILASKQVDATAMKRVQSLILQLIGGLDPSLGQYVIPQDADSLAAAAVCWDSQKHIRFAMPFGQAKIDIYLDDLLPRVVDLALNSSDRQTKVAASELLHSIIILMIGTGSQQQEGIQAKYPMAALYHHIFQAMLQLACDPDQVTRQLFFTLTHQTIHWFTNNKKNENPDTAVLLESIMDGIVTANNPALRDVSAQCLAEFVIWSRKQSREKNQASLNLKSILKRIFSFCKHPSAFKRLGGSLAWNSIYREVREDSLAVETWTLEILSHLMSALDLAHNDDLVLGTHEQTRAAILHVRRILIVRKELFWKMSSNRRIPIDFEGGTFEDMLLWLLEQCGSPKTLVRHMSMELLESLAPHSKDYTSVHKFIGQQLEKPESIKKLVDIIEGGGQAGLGIKHHTEPTSLATAGVPGNLMNIYFEALLAGLDGYSWLIGKGIVPADKLLKCKESRILLASSYFLQNIATKSLSQYVKDNIRVSETGAIGSPLEYEASNKLKCTVVVRLFDFVCVLLQDGVQSVQLLNEYSIFTAEMYGLILQCVLNPSSVGFDVKDTEVTKHLPSRMEEVLKVMQKKVPNVVSAAFIQTLEKYLGSPQYDVLETFTSPLAEGVNVPLKSQHVIEGLQILQRSGWLAQCSVIRKSLASELIMWVCNSLFMYGSASSPHPTQLPFLHVVLDFAVTLDSQVLELLVKQVTNMEDVKGVTGQQIEKGFHILNVLGNKIIPHILPCCDLIVTTLLELVKEGKFLEVMSFNGMLLNTLIRNSELRKKHSVKVVQAFLHHWSTYSTEAGKSSIHQESVLDLLSSLFLVDREGTMKAHCSAEDAGVLKFYRRLLIEDKATLSMKNKALKLLPFFLTMSKQVSKSISEDLEMVSFKHFPMQSSEFPVGGSRDRDYHQALSEILTALELSLSLELLKFILQVFCNEDKHRYEEAFNESIEKFIKRQQVSKQIDTLRFVYDMYANQSHLKQNLRYNIMEKVLIPLLQLSDLTVTVSFSIDVIKPVMAGMSLTIQGRSDEQQRLLVTKIGSFKILQVIFSRLPRERIFNPGSEINAAYQPSDTSGKELTKDVLRQSSKVAKGELRHDQTQAEFRRLCACAAYNTLIAVLVCVKDDLKFYTSLLFNANPTKGEAIWECLIDCNRNLQFDIEINLNPGSKRRFVAVRKNLKEANQSSGKGAAGTVQYLASHYLDDSSLREDLSQFDFSNSVVLAMSQREDNQYRIAASNDETGELLRMNFEQSDYNEHEVMANLTAAIYHMVDAKIMMLHKEDSTPSAAEIPPWMTIIQQKLESGETHRNVKLFLLRLMMNTSRVFAPYAVHFINPVLTCLVDGTTGDRINYFFSDLIVMVMGWGKRAGSQDSTMGRNMVSRVLRFLCSNTPHNRADVFRYNIDAVKSVVECWRAVLTVPYAIIYSLMEVSDGRNKEQEAGLNLLGIMLANGLAPYTEDSVAEKTKCEKILLKLLEAHYASIYGAAAEVVGLVLKFQSSHSEDCNETSFEENVARKVMEMMHSKQGQGITVIYKIHLHFPAVLKRVMNRLLSVLPNLYGIFCTRVLECLASYSSSMEDIYSHLKEHNVLGLLSKKEESTQLVSLELVNAVLPRLTPSQVLYFLPGITGFASHPGAKCREMMYDILFWIYDNFRESSDSEGSQIEAKTRVSLLQAVKEKDAALRQTVLNFWLERFQDMVLHDRVLHILKMIYSPETEDSFLELAMYIILEATRYSADYQRDIFQHPLTLCKFREMKVSTAWRARHASMIPLFMDTQVSSDSSLRSLTQSNEAEDDVDGPRGVAATQANVFSATQQTGGTFNWVTESTFDTSLADMEYAATHAPIHGSASGPMFNVGAHGKKNMNRYKKSSIGNTCMQPAETSTTTDSGNIQSKLLRKRFYKDQDREKQTIFFAKQEERRNKMRATLEMERKLRREAQVTMYRQYRVGELPDIQIPHRALIAPLQALSQRDNKVAQLLFDVVVQAVVDNADSLMTRGEKDTWIQQLHSSVNVIIANSYMCHPDMLRTVLHLVINNDILVSPDALAAACLGGHLEALGVLVLERQVLLSQKGLGRDLPPPQKKLKTHLNSQLDTSTWINMAELYKNLSMWDVVRGIIHSKLGRIKPETREALEAEATNDSVQAFIIYRTALNTQWPEEPDPAEVHLWEECYASCAAKLGQWSELENFVENRLLKDEAGQVSLNQVWTLPRPAVSVLPSIVNSKLMSILDGSETDRNLNAFIDSALGEPNHRNLLESTLPLPLAIMSAHQQKMAQARHYITLATSKVLLTLAQSSLLTPKPLTGTVRDIQLVTELGEFLETLDYTHNENYPNKVRKTVKNWKTQETCLTDSSVLMQFLSSHRELYFQFLEKELPQDCLEDIQKLMKDAKSSLHKSVIKTALMNKNYHLANRHLKKLRPLCGDDEELAKFYFLMTETNIQRGRSRPQNRLQYLVEAWVKFLGKVTSMPVLEQDATIETEYLKLESSLCVEISEAMKDMGNSWQEDDKYIKSLAEKFPNAKDKSSWYKELLCCSYKSLKSAVNCGEEKFMQLNNLYEGAHSHSKDIYMTLAKYCEDCLEKWKESIDVSDYADSLVMSVLRAMSLGSREAHFHFPRVINLMSDDSSLVATFKKEAKKVPVWMFLLWISHILIYVDKLSGEALQPIVEKLALEYPQAIVYPFRISMKQYDFTGSVGKAAQSMCQRVESSLCKNSLFHHFVTAMSLIVVPENTLKKSFKKILLIKNKEDIEVALNNLVADHLKVNNRSTRGMAGEKGEVFCKVGKLKKDVNVALTKEFGGKMEEFKRMPVEEIKKRLNSIRTVVNQRRKENAPNQLKAYSPWLANFQASKHSDVLEIPGQYSGVSKPLPEYHVNISSFDENVMPMQSLRVPLRIVIRGSDEKDHKYLVKWGEDLRTDQRMQQVFTLMNSVYSSSPLCAHTSFHPSLDTYQVIPLSSEVGMLKWVESTQPLLDFIKDSFKEGEAKCLDEAETFYRTEEPWNFRKKTTDKRRVKKYEDAVNRIPWDILRRGLVRLSSSSEGFFSLRSLFANSYATMCVSHWLLGIGDRHCGNTLVSLKTGRVVGIDFGHHFETAVQVLPFPELMPFRLTPQIVNVFQPLGPVGMIKDVMVAVLGTLQESRHVILSVLEAFVKEPTEDWKEFVRELEGNLDESKIEMFSEERMRCLKEKLTGFNPAYVTVWALSKNKAVRRDPTAFEELKKVVLGQNCESARANMDRTGLTIHQQVDILLEQATDPNILGRTWVGWSPFI